MYRKITEQGILRALQRRGENAGLDGFTVHDFRRTFITNLIDAGTDIITIQKLVGHASANTTAIYDMRGEEAKKRAIDLINVIIPEPDKKKTKTQKSKDSSLRCPNCKSKKLLKNGFQVLADGNKHQSYRCKKCSYAFTPLLPVPDK